jgi:FMN phosphatase YigB (HAD superfamily)
LNWIQQTKLLDVVDDYLDAEAMPYEKLDNGIFQAMFEHLGKTRKVHDPKLLDLQGYLRCVF